jgi:hypothetical protein
VIAFKRYIGIDYSGAGTPETPLTGIRVFMAETGHPPQEVRPVRGHWSRRGVSEWLLGALAEEGPVLVGIDHSFSFPESYFKAYGLQGDWTCFLEDFVSHYPTDRPGVTVRSLRAGTPRTGSARDRRWVEVLTRAKSVFHFDVPGSVATSTHAGLPWLYYWRRNVTAPLHFWPFDGTDRPSNAHVIAEVYPAVWYREGAPPDWSRDQWDAYLIAETLARAGEDGRLMRWFEPQWPEEASKQIAREGWILGVEKKPTV